MDSNDCRHEVEGSTLPTMVADGGASHVCRVSDDAGVQGCVV